MEKFYVLEETRGDGFLSDAFDSFKQAETYADDMWDSMFISDQKKCSGFSIILCDTNEDGEADISNYDVVKDYKNGKFNLTR